MMMVVEMENIIDEVKKLEREYDDLMKDANLNPNSRQFYLDKAREVDRKINRRMRILEIIKD